MNSDAARDASGQRFLWSLCLRIRLSQLSNTRKATEWLNKGVAKEAAHKNNPAAIQRPRRPLVVPKALPVVSIKIDFVVTQKGV